MLYKYEDGQGNVKLVEALHLSHAANYIAKQEFSLTKVSAAEAVALRDKDVPLIKVPEPPKREKK